MVDPRGNADRRSEYDLLVHAYADNELGPAEALDVERAINADPALSLKVKDVLALKQALAENFPQQALSDQFRKRIDAAIGRQQRVYRPSWIALAASVVLSVGLSSLVTGLVLRSSQQDGLVEQLVDRHMQRLVAGSPADIASSDRHTVKPWFNGKLPQAPHVVDLTAEGFPLLGARIEVIGTALMPSLVYGRRRHVISLTEMPKGQASRDVPRTINGFNAVTWSDANWVYWAVSDLNKGELETFAKLMQNAPPG